MTPIHCHECGSRLGAQATMCGNCGMSVAGASQRDERWELRMLLVRLVFIVMSAVGIWLFCNRAINQSVASPKNSPLQTAHSR